MLSKTSFLVCHPLRKHCHERTAQALKKTNGHWYLVKMILVSVQEYTLQHIENKNIDLDHHWFLDSISNEVGEANCDQFRQPACLKDLLEFSHASQNMLAMSNSSVALSPPAIFHSNQAPVALCKHHPSMTTGPHQCTQEQMYPYVSVIPHQLAISHAHTSQRTNLNVNTTNDEIFTW